VIREWTGGSRSWPEDRDVETGEVLVYVARGSLEVDLDGDVHALGEGDALLFDGEVPHRLRRTGGTATRALRVASALGPS
jgi:quercetin dioxygenase-like cupin family protein